MPDILIKNTKVFYKNYLQPGEIVIEDGKIKKLERISVCLMLIG